MILCCPFQKSSHPHGRSYRELTSSSSCAQLADDHGGGMGGGHGGRKHRHSMCRQLHTYIFYGEVHGWSHHHGYATCAYFPLTSRHSFRRTNNKAQQYIPTAVVPGLAYLQVLDPRVRLPVHKLAHQHHGHHLAALGHHLFWDFGFSVLISLFLGWFEKAKKLFKYIKKIPHKKHFYVHASNSPRNTHTHKQSHASRRCVVVCMYLTSRCQHKSSRCHQHKIAVV